MLQELKANILEQKFIMSQQEIENVNKDQREILELKNKIKTHWIGSIAE